MVARWVAESYFGCWGWVVGCTISLQMALYAHGDADRDLRPARADTGVLSLSHVLLRAALSDRLCGFPTYWLAGGLGGH